MQVRCPVYRGKSMLTPLIRGDELHLHAIPSALSSAINSSSVISDHIDGQQVAHRHLHSYVSTVSKCRFHSVKVGLPHALSHTSVVVESPLSCIQMGQINLKLSRVRARVYVRGKVVEIAVLSVPSAPGQNECYVLTRRKHSIESMKT